MQEPEAVIHLLRRVFRGGVMRRLPRKRKDAEVVIALAIVGLAPDAFHDESEVDAHLSAWLHIIGGNDGDLDHVTLRRSLVDYGFLRRASDGVVYRVVPERTDAVLSPGAQLVDPKRVFFEVQAEQHERRERFGPAES